MFARTALAPGLLAAATSLVHAGTLTADLERTLAARGTHADVAVIVRFTDPVDPQPFTVRDRRARDNRLLVALKARATEGRRAIDPLLEAEGARRVRDLWIVNGVAATLPAVAVRKLAALDGVATVDVDSFVQSGRSQRLPPPRTGPRELPALPAPAPARDERAAALAAQAGWNIAAVRAPEVWAQGVGGRGVVVATMDTGADLAHPDLQRTWRAGGNSWFDPYGEEPVPYDALGHGTQALGVIVGGQAIGIAPEARWIAVRLYDANGRARMSDIHRAFQWLMDPDGDAATLDAPDVVNASWTLLGRAPGTCIGEFAADIRALKASGIAVVFAAGNDGPAPSTSSSPANNPGALSVGAADRDLALARMTSRGPSSCDGSDFPRVIAPGTNIRTTDLAHGGPAAYANTSGTSLAAPHVAGVLALLMSAFPAASLDELEAALARGARRAEAGAPTGVVDAKAAFDLLQRSRDEGAHAPIYGAVAPLKAPPRTE